MATEINLTPTASFVEIARARYVLPTGANAESAEPVIPARTWGTANDCFAGALLVHGLGAHSGWFEALGRRLKVRRIFALSYDQVGFGRRRSQQFFSRTQWFEDLATSYAYLKKLMGDKPVYVMGNSMGAAVAFKVVGDQLISPTGLVLFSPGFDGHPGTFKLRYKLLAVLRALMHPESEIALPYTPEMVTRSVAVRNWLTNDPDRRFSPTGKMLLELLKLTISLPRITSIACPTLMVNAGIDVIVDNAVSQRIFDKLQCRGKKQRIFEAAWHDLMFDPVIDDLIEELASWVVETSRVPAEKSHTP